MKRILVIQTASIGDVILATAVIESLHRTYSDAKIDILVKKGHETLFTEHPFLNEVLTWNKKGDKLKELFHLIAKTRREHFNLVINIQRFFSSGMITVCSGASDTRGFRKNPLSLLFSKRVRHEIGNGLHEVERNNLLISELTGKEPLRPSLYPTTADEAAVAPYISGKFYTISPASLWATKQYPAEKWVDLIRHISPSEKIYLLGAQVDAKLCNELISSSNHPALENLAGQLTLLQSAALMKRARMNFTNDSAPMHLASAVNAPVTAVFCSTIPGFGFGPLSDNSAIAEHEPGLDCRPCGLHGYKACPKEHFRCGLDIDTTKLTARL